MMTVLCVILTIFASTCVVGADRFSPLRGWNSYDSFGGSVTEAEVMAAAQAQIIYLRNRI